MKSFTYQEYLDSFKYSRIIKFGKIKNIRPIFIQPEFIQLYPTKRLLKYIWLFFLLIPTIIFSFLFFLSMSLQMNFSNDELDFETLLQQRSSLITFFFLVAIPLIILILIVISFQLRKSSEWLITKGNDNSLVISIKNENTRIYTSSYPCSILQELAIEQSGIEIPFLKDKQFQFRLYLPFITESTKTTDFYLLTGKKDDLEIFKELFIAWSNL